MATHLGAPLGPADVPEPLPTEHNEPGTSGFKTGTKVEGVQRAISQRGLYVIIAIAALFVVTVLDCFNIIHIDLFGLIPHATTATTTTVPTPEPSAFVNSSAPNDGVLSDILNSSPTPAPAPSPTPNRFHNPMPTAQQTTVSPGVTPQMLPEHDASNTSSSAPVPNVDTSGPSATYAPQGATNQSALRPTEQQVANSPSSIQQGPSPIDQARSSDINPTIGTNSGQSSAQPVQVSPNQSVVTQAATANDAIGTLQQRSANVFNKTTPGGYLESTRTPAISKYEIWPGRKLRMLLDDAIIVDLPGTVCGHFLEAAKDSETGTVVLFPERTELCGNYNTIVSSGASRIQVAWKQATFPDGSTLPLDNMGSADRNGWSGLSADVNNHTGAIIGTALLTSVTAGVLAAANPSATSNLGVQVQTPGQAAGQSILQSGQQIVAEKANLPPTLSLKKSTEILLSVDRAIVLPPYHSIPAMDQK